METPQPGRWLRERKEKDRRESEWRALLLLRARAIPLGRRIWPDPRPRHAGARSRSGGAEREGGSCPFFCQEEAMSSTSRGVQELFFFFCETFPSLSRLAPFSQAHFLPTFNAQTTTQETNYPSQRTRANDGAVRGVFSGGRCCFIFSKILTAHKPIASLSLLAPSKNTFSFARGLLLPLSREKLRPRPAFSLEQSPLGARKRERGAHETRL